MKLFKEPFGVIRKNKSLFTLSCFLDLLFIASFLIIFAGIMQAIFPVLVQVSQVTSGFHQLAPDLDALAAASLDNHGEFLAIYGILLKWLSILAASLIGLWLIIQGLNFFVTSKMFNKKTKFFETMGKFCLLSVFYYIFIMLSFYLTVFLSSANSRFIFPLFTQGIINGILFVLLLVILYFSALSLTHVRKKSVGKAMLFTFKTALKKKVFVALLVIVAVVALASLLSYYAFSLHTIVFYLSFLILIPSISFSRIFFFTELEKV